MMTDTTDEKLKQRLKDLYDDPREYSLGQISEACGVALDRIKELEEKLFSATMDGYDMAKYEYRDRIEELEAKLATCEKYRDAYAECDRIGAQAVRQLEAKLAQGIVAEYDDGSRVSLSAHAGGASEGGAWSHLTLMKEEQDGAVSFRRYTADGDWRSPIVSSATAELEGPNDE